MIGSSPCSQRPSSEDALHDGYIQVDYGKFGDDYMWDGDEDGSIDADDPDDDDGCLLRWLKATRQTEPTPTPAVGVGNITGGSIPGGSGTATGGLLPRGVILRLLWAIHRTGAASRRYGRPRL